MDAKQELIRKFYEARSRGDWTAVRKMLAPDVTWHELGPEQDYSGDHRGRDTVTALLEQLVDATQGDVLARADRCDHHRGARRHERALARGARRQAGRRK